MKRYSSKAGEKAGVIDLGTNTFHLMITPLGRNLDESRTVRHRSHVRIGEYSNDFIGEGPMERAVSVMKEFAELLKEEKVRKVKAVGTAMLRNATNTREFIDRVLLETGIKIEVISGNKEAELIFKGVKLSDCLSGETDLLMDIGGGSVEFIWVEGGKMSQLWSFDIGVSFLKNLFHKSEPMANEERKLLENHLLTIMHPMLNIIDNRPAHRLIGISGTFDLIHEHFNPTTPKGSAKINPEEIIKFSEQIIGLSAGERLKHPSIPESRADLIPSALVLLNLILRKCSISEVIVSPYSIKEGVFTTLV